MNIITSTQQHNNTRHNDHNRYNNKSSTITAKCIPPISQTTV